MGWGGGGGVWQPCIIYIYIYIYIFWFCTSLSLSVSTCLASRTLICVLLFCCRNRSRGSRLPRSGWLQLLNEPHITSTVSGVTHVTLAPFRHVVVATAPMNQVAPGVQFPTSECQYLLWEREDTNARDQLTAGRKSSAQLSARQAVSSRFALGSVSQSRPKRLTRSCSSTAGT